MITESLTELQRSNALMRELLAFEVSLSAKQDLSQLADKIVEMGKALCRADAGILYLPSQLQQPDGSQSSYFTCAVMQIDSRLLHYNLLRSAGDLPELISQALPPICGSASASPAGLSQSLMAAAALTGSLIEVPCFATHPNRWPDDAAFDQDWNYNSVSGLAVPLQSNNQMLGLLKLLNAKQPNSDEIGPFDATVCEIMQWFAALVGNALNDQLLLQDQANWVKAEQELQVGRKIQLDFLPETLPQIEGWEIAARFEPAREVAGDFYDAFSVGHGRVGIVIADVCDKGVGAALFMSLFRSFLRILAQQNYSLGLLDMLVEQPNAQARQAKRSHLPSIGTQALKNAVERTNAYIAETHWRTSMFATLFFGILDPSTGKLIYINGGHESPFIINAQGIKERLTRTGPAVGIFPNAEFQIEMTQLDPGDILLGYTDGIPDARSPQHDRYTEPRLSSLIESSAAASATELLDRITADVHAHISYTAPFDDITMIALRRH